VPLTLPRRRHATLVLLVACALLAGVAPAYAAPADPDGNNAKLTEKLQAAARGYTAAAARLKASQRRQGDLARQMRAKDVEVAMLTEEVGEVAAVAYRSGRMSGVAALLDSGSPDDFLSRALMLDVRVHQDDRSLHDLIVAKAGLAAARRDLDAEVRTQQAQVAEMAKRKKDAERALAAAGGGGPTSGLSGGTASASWAPRNADGTWPPESCSVDDPTTSGCLTPRTLHAYQEARKAGFTHYTSCWRSGGSGEHPKGRACDFAAAPNGFEGVAYGDDKAYGDRLASWFIANTDRLGVLYVIWYKRIWMPGIGWRSYSGDGTPSGDHYNHVHLSVQ
jgi:hypothetical protein